MQGVVRIFQTGFKLWTCLSTADQAWEALMKHLEQAVLIGSHKVRERGRAFVVQGCDGWLVSRHAGRGGGA